MKSLNLFSRAFTVIVLTTVGSLALAAYSAKRAYETDPQLVDKIQKHFNIQIGTGNGFYIGSWSDREATQDSWQMPLTQKKIHIKTITGRIAIKNTSSGEVSIVASGKINKTKIPKLLEVNSATDELYIAEPENAVSDLEVHIEIPSSYSQELVIETTSADVSIENISNNSLSIQTASGNIFLEAIKVDNLSLNTTSGDTQIHRSAITTLSGNSISGGLKIDSKGTASSRLKTVSGDIDLTLPKSQAFRFALKTVSGDIVNTHSEIKSSADATVDISTISGNIKIE